MESRQCTARSAFKVDVDWGHGRILGMDVTSCHASVRNKSETLRSDVFLCKKKCVAEALEASCEAKAFVPG